ncbi:MAG: proton-conducting membrane transporter, partial [Roseburia sp.]|nr:proton-conducting membrane transporter [Roseburia sp.]
MNAYYMVIAVLLPMFGGVLIPLLPFHKRNVMAFYTEGIVLLTSALTFLLILNRPTDAFVLFRFTGQLSI